MKPRSLWIASLIAVAAVTFAQDTAPQANEMRGGGTIMSSRERNLEVMRKLFRAVEQHDEESVLGLYQPDVEFHWPPSLPYGGSARGLRSSGPTWGETWAPLQPSVAERKMDPRVVAASDDEVVVLWHQRGVSPTGERFDGEVLGLYRFRDAKLARAQMFYFDTAAVNTFLAKAITPEMGQNFQTLFSRLRELPENRQLAVRQAYWRLQTMSPEQWHQELNSARLKGLFSDEECGLLSKLLSMSAKRGE
jgi:ketosteroid isomerase-like protein